MRVSLFILAAFLSLSSMPIIAASQVSLTDLPKIQFQKYKLANGLEVILVEDHRLPLVAVDMSYHVGAANETPGLTGFAHLFEHMMFAGSKYVPRGLADSLLEAAGGEPSNGATSFDRTAYFETVPSHQLELNLWLHADRMGYLLDVLDQTALSNQQDVVRNERRENIENEPYGIVDEALWKHLFPKEHPYHGVIMGSHADIQGATLGDIKNFFKLYYRPNNATLAIVGDFEIDDAKLLVEKYFGSLQRGPDVAPPIVTTPRVSTEKRVVVQDSVELPRVIMGWHTPKVFTPGDAELSLAGQILGGGKSSRLYRTLVYEKQIAQHVSAYQYSLGLGSVFFVDVTARPGHTATEIEAAIDQELDRLRSSTVTAHELTRAINTLEAELITNLETFGDTAEMANQFNHYTGDPNYFIEEINKYNQVTPPQIQQTVNQFLKKSARVVVHGVPGKPDLSADTPAAESPVTASGEGAESINAAEAWRKKTPKSGKRKPLDLPQATSFKLENGLTIIHHYRPNLPLVSAYLTFKSGSDANPVDKPGLASLTAALLDEGTKTRSALQIADEVATLGASLSIYALPDESSIELFSLKKNFAKVAEILADIALNPSFPVEEIERQRASRLAELAQTRDNAEALAEIASVAALYGFSHPYGYPVVGTETSLKSTSREDLVDFWRTHFVPNNAALVVSGDITSDELAALAQSLFGEWKGAAIKAKRVAKPEPTAAHLILVDKPDASQTELRVITMGPNRNTPDYAALEVANAALGGLFTSRINMSLREEKGYTYGAHSTFRYRRTPGPFEIQTAVSVENTAAAVKEILAEIRGLHKKPIARVELRKARDSQLLSLPGEFETGREIVHSLANTFLYDLGLDYYQRLPTMFRGVNESAIANMVEKYLRPETIIVVAVGDRQKIEPALMKLKLKPVEYRDLEGRIISPH